MTAAFIQNELLSVANPQRATFLQRFFKTGPGQYGEADRFLGLAVPLTRNIARANKKTPLAELQILMDNVHHEARLCALLILVEQFKKAPAAQRETIYNFYLQNACRINSWDLVDLSCPHIVGAYLLDKDRSPLYELAATDHLWSQRIAVVSTITFIRKGEYTDTLDLAERLIIHKHDLIHKAIGWMLREVGKKDRDLLCTFLDRTATRLPRTTLRYAIEHFPEEQCQYYLKKK